MTMYIEMVIWMMIWFCIYHLYLDVATGCLRKNWRFELEIVCWQSHGGGLQSALNTKIQRMKLLGNLAPIVPEKYVFFCPGLQNNFRESLR